MSETMTPERRAELQVFLHEFSDGIIQSLLTTLTTDTAFQLLQGLNKTEWDAVLAKVLQGCVGKPN
jgi:hypothetical protein